MTDHRYLVPSTRTPIELTTNTAVDYGDKFAGTLLGCAIGDALGAPVEGMSPDMIRDTMGTVREMISLHGEPAGLITDDTQLTIAVAESIVASGDLDPDDLAERFMAWMPLGRGHGATTVGAILNLQRGMAWWESGEPSAGNGAAMRVSPVALLHPFDVSAMRRDAAISAIITHADPMAVVSVAAQTFLVAALLHHLPGTLDVGKLLRDLSTAIGDLPDPGYPERRAGASGEVRLHDRLLEVGDRLDQSPAEAFAYFQNGAFVLESLPAALWSFLRSPEDPEEVIVTAVNGGYDADTVAAMAGALAGAYHGASGLPARWIEATERTDELLTLAERLLAS